MIRKLLLLVIEICILWDLKCENLPKSNQQVVRRQVIETAKLTAALSCQFAASSISSASFTSSSYTPSENRFTTIGDGMPMCRLLNGMWQVSGAHGFDPNKELAVEDMARYVDGGFTTFDLADIYGPAEDFVGSFRRGPLASPSAQECQFFTKWVPRPDAMPRKIVEAAVDRSLKRMRGDTLDLLQFHWWDYADERYYDAVAGLMHVQEQGKIRNLGLTNFDTEHMLKLIEQDAPIVTNQISYSVLDTRPAQMMASVCQDKGVKLLCYGSLLGGFLSSSWLGKSEPSASSLTNVSLRKYLPWINYWGGWELFQELLTTLGYIGRKHSSSISTVALRWVLDQPAVGGAIVGARLGYRQHIKENQRVFSLVLDEDDRQRIVAVQKKSTDLMKVFGDCGSEYRRRPRKA